MEEALEALSTVGGVTMSLSHVGLAKGSDGANPYSGSANSLFPVWKSSTEYNSTSKTY